MTKVQGPRIDSAWRLGEDYRRRQSHPPLPCRLADAHYLGRQGIERNSTEAVAHLNLIAAARKGDTGAREKLKSLSAPLIGNQLMINIASKATGVSPDSFEVVANKIFTAPLTMFSAIKVMEIILMAKAVTLTQGPGLGVLSVSGPTGISHRHIHDALHEHKLFNREDCVALLKEAGITVSAGEDLCVKKARETAELEMLTQALSLAENNVKKAAVFLGIPDRYMRYGIRKPGLSV